MGDLKGFHKEKMNTNSSDLINGVLHEMSGRFAYPKVLYDLMPSYYDSLSESISQAYDENGHMRDCAMHVMGEFIAKNYVGMSIQMNDILNNKKLYKVGIDKVEFTIDLPKKKFINLVEYLNDIQGVSLSFNTYPIYKANRVKYLHCIEVTRGLAKVVLHYQPFGRNKSQKCRFAKISLNFSRKSESDLSYIMELLKKWFGKSYYSALKTAVPTHVELKVDFNSIHPCMLAYRGSVKGNAKSDYQPTYKILIESALISSSSSKAKKIYFKSSEKAIKNKIKMGSLLITRFEFVVKQYNANLKSRDGKNRYYNIRDLDCSFPECIRSL